jgi:hypothetical protein
MLRAGFLLGLFFDPEDGSDVFLRNVCVPPKRVSTWRFILEQWYSTFFVCVPPDVISLQLRTPKVVIV